MLSALPMEPGLDAQHRRLVRNAAATKGRSVLEDAIRAGRLPKRIWVDEAGDVTEPRNLAKLALVALLSLPRQLILRVFPG
jgi:hypothetical protein